MKRVILLLILINLANVNFSYSKWINARDPGIFEDLYAMKFINKDTGFVAGWSRYGTIMKTTNGGEDWTKKDSLPYQIFSINTLDGNIIYASGYSLLNNCGLWLFSTDGGSTWIPDLFDGNENPFSFGFYTMELLNNKTFLMSGNFGIIVKTTDGGLKWDTVNTGVNNEVFTIMDFADENTGYAASGAGYDYEKIDKIYKTTDGGNNWFVIRERDSLLKIGTLKFLNPDVGYLFGKYAQKAVVMKTVDGGFNWTTNYQGRTDYMLKGGDLANENFIIAAGEKNYSIKSTDGGQNWEEENTGGVGEGYLIVDCVDEFYGYLGATRGLIMKYDLFLDVEEPNLYSDISLYPNPVEDFAYIKFDKINVNKYILKIYNNQGNEILAQSGKTNSHIDLNLKYFNKGIYFYSLLINGKDLINGKFIKY